MHKLFTLSLLLSSFISSFSQNIEWDTIESIYGSGNVSISKAQKSNDGGNFMILSIETDAIKDNNLILATPTWQTYLMKFDQSGSLSWSIPSHSDDKLTEDDNNDIYLVGKILNSRKTINGVDEHSLGNNLFRAKIDGSDGTFLWATAESNPQVASDFLDFFIDSDTLYTLSRNRRGSSTPFFFSDFGFYLTKHTLNGFFIEEFFYDFEDLSSIKMVNKDNKILFIGATESLSLSPFSFSGSNRGTFMAEINKLDGSMNWLKKYGTNNFDKITSTDDIKVIQRPDGTIYMGASFDGDLAFNDTISNLKPAVKSYFIASFLPNGEPLNQNYVTFGNSLSSFSPENTGNDFHLDSENNIYICGYFNDTLYIENKEVLSPINSSSESNIFVTKFDSDFNYVNSIYTSIDTGTVGLPFFTSNTDELEVNFTSSGQIQIGDSIYITDYNTSLVNSALSVKIRPGMTVGFSDNQQTIAFSAFPNPVSGSYFTVKSESRNSILEIRSATGQLEGEFTLAQGENTFGSKSFSKGIHILTLIEDSQKHHSKIIIE